jgi:exodeoxyribonuclease VIII
MTRKIMVDIETMGDGSDAAIIAIGAVEFGVEGLRMGYYDMIDLESSMKAGLSVSAGTIIWWMQQSEDARSLFNCETRGNLKQVLSEFGEWVKDKRGLAEEPIEMWGNGSDFDNVVLHNAYDKCNLDTPWNFRENRCYRTMKNMYPNIEAEKAGSAHCAIDDAKSQALHLIKIFRYISDVGEIARGH